VRTCLSFTSALSISDSFLQTEVSQMDQELARICNLLAAKYKSDHDNSCAYVDPVNGEVYQLTPFMMKEWSRYIVCSIFFHSQSLLTSLICTSSMMARQQSTSPPTRLHLILSTTSHLSAMIVAVPALLHHRHVLLVTLAISQK
jgi:hypothetical protein